VNLASAGGARGRRGKHLDSAKGKEANALSIRAFAERWHQQNTHATKKMGIRQGTLPAPLEIFQQGKTYRRLRNREEKNTVGGEGRKEDGNSVKSNLSKRNSAIREGQGVRFGGP